MTASLSSHLDLATAAVAQHSSLDLLVLFGSRARGDTHPASDWDFAFLGHEELDVESLLVDLISATSSDHVDLVNLSRAGGQLRFRVARDAVSVFERRAGVFERFAIQAASFWCDAEPVLREAYDRLLAGRGR